MILDEIKASLAIENLRLTSQEEQVLSDYIEGRISFDELRQFVAGLLKSKAA
ncbi:MAG: hypothetical protein SPL30_10620 [Succinivibrio sp.]|jgi:hypothetical protein|nr:hypothetical protein [Succinivibrio sp.]